MKTSLAITPHDRFHLSFGALFGYCFLQYVSGSLFVSILIGIPMGIGGMAVGIAVLRLLGIEASSERQRAIFLNNPVGVGMSIAAAALFAAALLFFLPNDDRSLSGLFLGFMIFYIVSYILRLAYFTTGQASEEL